MAAVLEKARWRVMEGHFMPKKGRLYSDQIVTATELNRHCGTVLDMALNKPITITRNDEHFALLPRELAAQLAALSDQVGMYVEAVRAIRSVLSGKELHEDHQYRWLCAYETDDLVLMQDELMEAIAQVSQGDDVEAVEDTIHEWHESAIAALSDVLDAAFKAESEPIEHTPPPNDPETVEA